MLLAPGGEGGCARGTGCAHGVGVLLARGGVLRARGGGAARVVGGCCARGWGVRVLRAGWGVGELRAREYRRTCKFTQQP